MRQYTVHDFPKKNRFIGASQAGQSITAAAKAFDIPPSTAYDLVRKFKATGTTHAWPCTGRPCKVTPRVTQNFVCTVVNSRRMPLQDIGNSISPQLSPSTVQNILDKRNYHHRKAGKVPYLTKRAKVKRFCWAQKYSNYGVEDWRSVIWLDECYIHLSDDRGTVLVT